MAKVKKTETKLQPGKPVKKTETKTSVNAVTAVRNGIERTFTRPMWDHLPPSKEGWQEQVETPSIPKPKETPTTYEDAVKAYTEVFGEAPGQDLTIDDINAAIAEKGDGDA